MKIDLETIIKEARNVNIDIFKELLSIEFEYYKKEIGNYFELEKGILKFSDKNYKYVYVFGDIHGDFLTLVELLKKIKFDRVIDNSLFIFLGDYIDRGVEQVEALTLLFYLHKLYPGNIILLRGNHERPKWLFVYPHDFPDVLTYKFGRESKDLYEEILDLFDLMPHIAYYDDGLIFLHGGLPIDEYSLDKLTSDNREYLTQILWNDPFDGEGYRPSFRGIGYLFGKDITKRFLKENSLKGLVRGHEPVEGYRISKEGYTLTLFTRLGPPYYNHKAAIYRYEIKSFTNFNSGEFILLEEG